MNSKTQVIVFGLKDEAPAESGCGCSCGDTGCGPTPTMGEMYQELSEFLTTKVDNIEFKFVDILEDELEEHEDVLELLEKQFPIPFTKINGKMAFYGGISNEAIYEDIKKLNA
ncbi:MAG: hypothetical protein CVV02_04655 [Firmicutes bacterium HGW-Firmicutes-7]|nr:MAG: hypothetical protein CVV02_04655 [Firmicutes bacterium HGW-Firmicutes-7]